jgi:hypothetical protein
VKIVASGTVSVDGVISARGTTNAISRAGGGSGGGIYIQCGNLTGSGTIRADGGDGGPGTYDGGGGGGGGRIAIHVFKAPLYSPGCYRGTWTVNGGAGGGAGGLPGSLGTVYLDFKSRGTVLSTW